MRAPAPTPARTDPRDPWARLRRVEATPNLPRSVLVSARAAALALALAGEVDRARGRGPERALLGVEALAADARGRPPRPLHELRHLVDLYAAVRSEPLPRSGLLASRAERARVVERRRELAGPLIEAVRLLSSGYGERRSEAYLRDRLSGVPAEWARRRTLAEATSA